MTIVIDIQEGNVEFEVREPESTGNPGRKQNYRESREELELQLQLVEVE